MNELAQIGKRRTIIVSTSVILISIFTIYNYHSLRLEIDSTKLIQQIVRFLLTIGLLYATYIGKNWAKIIAVLLFSLAVLGAIYGVFTTVELPFMSTIPLYVMIFIYGNAISHFGFSQSYKAFAEYQKSNRSPN